MTHSHRNRIVLRMKQMTQKLSISRSSIYEKMNPKSPRFDATFPKPIRLGAASVGWLENQVDEWLMSRQA
ncbi:MULTISPECIES: AlpA family phage regulatory protein [Halomonadaceae]|jgi:prophage regulatory protein|uniref:AlpA family phage regulatory protein n=2 Tax=root TaxID=1 RepID=A0A7Z0SNA2_9GAMM|nr:MULTISPECIES: AlpA family phage regulatory protein [Halomonas]QGQ69925.1 AlpA family phage regulatory protein [Halomonas sp. PA16-9]NVE92443.1 AlpA family phage regulatory protein [Halomonas titanicae]NYT74572.1 AlpA family phage regulatory protein [Halomonas sedimenti]PKH63351.1 AlpA family phage regulatory protein [Halomonas sp. Choline-3u-9]HDZ47136.1 AlpA family phage regulatory protein [Halomonas sp.]|tara:strand:- start:1492 stop:1701 length:210 start_codon:yes stop_codon:yes gene_type:complete